MKTTTGRAAEYLRRPTERYGQEIIQKERETESIYMSMRLDIVWWSSGRWEDC